MSEERELVSTSEPTVSQPVETARPESAPIPKPKPSFGQRLGRAFAGFMKFVFILFILALFLGGIGAGLYFGLPYLHNAYVLPLNQNTARISQVAEQQARDVLALQSQIDGLTSEIADLKNRNVELESQLADAQAEIAAHTELLKTLEELQAKLDAAAQEQSSGLNAALARQLRLTRAIELLSRARLYLSQSNFGQARLDVQAAREQLAVLREESPDPADQASFDDVLFRLDLALGNLPGFPVVAAADLDIAWNLLVLDEPQAAPTETPQEP